ncbi:MAG: DEAD/DEAH box helicase, partial [Acidimicrobiales bacterium]|nr:DEAD/DEAH box helicase [Acidimicrobiales bacterium]
LEAAVVVQRMHDGLIEHTRVPRNPLDVLAQQIVAAVALEPRTVGELATLVRGAAPFAGLSDEALANVLEMLAGRYPSDEFGELRPRVVWDRTTDTVSARPGAQRLAVTNPGTIPDRGLYGVFLPDGTRVGELDEEMVYESRPGETFLLGASTWRIEEITFDRVVVTPAPGQPGKMPFWHGDGPGRPIELGRAVGAFTRELRASPRDAAYARLVERHGLDDLAARNLLAFLDDQAAATGVVPDDRTVVVERFRDEIGDWRVCVLTPFGARVHAPWAIALRSSLAEVWGVDPEIMWSDDGIVLRLPEAVDEVAPDALALAPDEVRDRVVGYLHTAPLFATVFREAAARALLLPRRRPDRRTPLWQQRQRAADLLGVAGRFADFPILLEATRECVDDLFDVPALLEVLEGLAQRRIRMVAVDSSSASPMAESLLFAWVGVYMYAYDAPLAERRAMALSLDRELLADLLGAEELRELLDPEVLDALEADLQRTSEGRRARDHHAVHDLLRGLGPLTVAEVAARCRLDGVADGADVAAAWLGRLATERRAFEAQIAGEARWIAAEDAARVRDALGTALPPGLPAAYTDPVAAPLEDLVSRYARTHGPFVAAEVARRYGIGIDPVTVALRALEGRGRVVQGEFRPGGVQREWCDAEVLRQVRRRSLAALRREIEPVDAAALARFAPGWQCVGGRRGGADGVADALGVLAGVAIPASVLERDVLPARVPDYRPADLDALCAAGEVVWAGAGPLGRRDGRIRLCFRDQAPMLLTPWIEAPAAPSGDGERDAALDADPADDPTVDPGPAADEHVALRHALRTAMADHGALFWPDLVAAAAEAGCPHDDDSVLDAIWALVWAGVVTNDSLGPVRALLPTPGRRSSGRGAAGRRRPRVGALRAVGPPAGSGRWSLVAPLLTPPATPTEQAHALAAQLLERHGLVTRETVRSEGVPGGFAALYPVLGALEERGHVRRGYFVAGLGGAQFALPGAVDRVRAPAAADDPPLVLAATDPAQPYGAVLPWPPTAGRPARAAGALVVLWRGLALAWLDRSGTGLWRFPTADAPALDGVAPDVVDRALADALVGIVRHGRRRSMELRTVDGEPARTSSLAPALLQAGCSDGYRGLVVQVDGRASRADGA